MVDEPCPLMQTEVDYAGWQIEEVWLDEEHRFAHLVPCMDLRLHQLDASCWCGPVEDPEAPDCWVHNSADGRELFERGERRVS